MGRHAGTGKDKADDCNDIDVFWLRQHGYFCGLKSGGIKWTNGWSRRESSVSFSVYTMYDSSIKFSYTRTDLDGNKEDLEYEVQLVSTPCHYGGKRYWFICPLQRNGIPCGRRVGKLYLGGKYFGCRHCYDLSYDSRSLPSSGKWKIWGDYFKHERQYEHLYNKVKIRYRKGRPTKKYLKLLRLGDQHLASAEAMAGLDRHR